MLLRLIAFAFLSTSGIWSPLIDHHYSTAIGSQTTDPNPDLAAGPPGHCKLLQPSKPDPPVIAALEAV